MTFEYVWEREVQRDCMSRQINLTGLQKFGMEIKAHCNSSQAPWMELRDLAVANCAMSQSGLLWNVEDFCFAVFDCLEPNVPKEMREQRMIHVGALAVPLNLRIVDAGRRLTASANAFLVKWNIVARMSGGIWYNRRWRSGRRVVGCGPGGGREMKVHMV